jgi:hypothetical protein
LCVIHIFSMMPTTYFPSQILLVSRGNFFFSNMKVASYSLFLFLCLNSLTGKIFCNHPTYFLVLFFNISRKIISNDYLKISTKQKKNYWVTI